MRAQLLICFSLVFLSQLVLAQGKDAVVAKVGSKTITLEEFNRRYNEIKSLASNPPPKKVFLEDLVRYEAGVQEAEKRGVNQNPIVAERVRQELYKGLVELETHKQIENISVNEDEMKKYYSENPDIRFSSILILVKQNATTEEKATARKRAEEILAEVRASKRPFEELVKLYTDDVGSKARGGDMGFQNRLTLQPNIADALSKLKTGEVSGILEAPLGFYILKATGRRNYEAANKNAIRAGVFEKKRLAIISGFTESVKKKYSPTINYDAIK